MTKSPFASAAEAAGAVLTTVRGERVRIVARASTASGRPMPDGVRESGTVNGVFFLTSTELDIVGGPGMRGGTVAAISAARLWLTADAMEALGFQPDKDDAVYLLDRNPDSRWTVVRADPNDIGDVMLHIDREVVLPS